MSTIETPAEFKMIARNIAVGVFEFINSTEDLVSVSLIGIDQNHAATVRPFLKSILASNMQADELTAYWSSMPSGIYISNGEAVRKLLEAILSRLEKEPYLTGVLASR